MSKTILRLTEPRDMPALLEKLAEQNRRDKTRYPMPEIFDEDGNQADNIPLAYTVERGGEVYGAIVFESKGVEMMLVGCSPRVTLTIGKEARGVLFTLSAMGFRWIKCHVSKSILGQVKAAMKAAGFSRFDGKFASFFRDL
ncbi:MAG: hypothetical protein WCA44_05805 [Acidobacteriaceae bacterium]